MGRFSPVRQCRRPSWRSGLLGRRGTGLGVGGGHLGLGAVVVLGLIGWMLGINPAVLIGGAEMVNGLRSGGNAQRAPAPSQTAQTGAPTDQMGQFVAAVLAENEDVWSDVLPAQKGVAYVKPKLVLYSGSTRSGCGGANASMGPFYCPNDQKVYLDTSFFNDMKRQASAAAAISLTPMSSRTRSAIISRTCSAFCLVSNRRRCAPPTPVTRLSQTRFRSGSN